MPAQGIAIANRCAIVNLLCAVNLLRRSIFSTAGSFGYASTLCSKSLGKSKRGALRSWGALKGHYLQLVHSRLGILCTQSCGLLLEKREGVPEMGTKPLKALRGYRASNRGSNGQVSRL